MAGTNESAVEYPIPVALNSDVALECDIVDAKPPPQIKWYSDLGEIQEITEANRVRFLDSGQYLYLRMLNSSHLNRQYYCAVMNAYMYQEIAAPTRYLLVDNLTRGELVDYKQIGNQKVFVGNTSFEFSYVGGNFDNSTSNRDNGTRSILHANNAEVDNTLGSIGKIDTMTSQLLSSPGIIQLRASVSYNSLSSLAMRSGSVAVHRKLHDSVV